jgi:hypothetical protein
MCVRPATVRADAAACGDDLFAEWRVALPAELFLVPAFAADAFAEEDADAWAWLLLTEVFSTEGSRAPYAGGIGATSANATTAPQTRTVPWAVIVSAPNAEPLPVLTRPAVSPLYPRGPLRGASPAAREPHRVRPIAPTVVQPCSIVHHPFACPGVTPRCVTNQPSESFAAADTDDYTHGWMHRPKASF